MPRKSKHQKLTYRVDSYVHRLIDQAEKSELTIAEQTSVLNAIGKWVVIKNKLIDGMEGEKLADFRARLKKGSSHALGDALGRAEPTGGGQSSQHVDREQKSRAGRLGMGRRWGFDPELTDGTGAGLAEFKKRIPRADDGADI